MGRFFVDDTRRFPFFFRFWGRSAIGPHLLSFGFYVRLRGLDQLQQRIGIRQKKYEKAWQALGEAADINSANMNVLANQFIFEACLK